MKQRIFLKRTVNFTNIRNFNPLFWMICGLSILEKMTIVPFIQNSSEMFQIKYNLDLQETGTIIAIPFIVFIFLAPFLGIIMDKIGKRGYILIVGFVALFLSQLIFLNFEECPSNDKCYEGIFPMSLLGMAYTII
jgi:MFS family permease